MRFSERMSLLGTESAFEVLAKARKLEAQGKSIIHLEIGEPDFDTPKNICEAGIKAIKDGQTHYCPSGGLPETRKVVAEYVSKTRNTSVNPENVVIMPGAKPVIFNSIFAALNAGDEVILPDPGYPIYGSVVSYVGAKPVLMNLKEENDFRFDTNELRALITPKTKMIIINYPQNPTGGILTKEDLEIICKLAVDNDLWIIADEIYSRIIYDVQFESILNIPGAKERTILVDGMSKTYAMTGWRLGYGVMPVEMANYLTQLAINNFSSTATFAQYALMEALTGPQDDVDKMIAEFKKRRDIIVAGLNRIEGISCKTPLGAFYAYANIKGTGMTSKQFANFSMEEAGVACLAGTAFGAFGEGYARFSYANSVENIEEAVKRIENSLAKVKV